MAINLISLLSSLIFLLIRFANDFLMWINLWVLTEGVVLKGFGSNNNDINEECDFICLRIWFATKTMLCCGCHILLIDNG